MANYTTIFYTRGAVQLDVPETQTEMPLNILVEGYSLPVYRDDLGFYVPFYTKQGYIRARESQWVVLIADEVAEVPEVPAEIATGSFEVTGTAAAGDGVVGFSYDGINYTVAPTVGDTTDISATNLENLVNVSGLITCTRSGSVLTISSVYGGVVFNKPVADVSTDTNQAGTAVGLTGGADYVPVVPAVPPTYEVYDDGDFQLVYEPEV